MKRNACLILLALPLGVWMSVTCIRPVPTIPLSDLVLQLSGSRGFFPFHPSLLELLELTLRLIPCFLFQALAGLRLYRNFCVASVYVFSRLPDRLRWYRKAVLEIAGCAALYELVLLAAAMAAAAVRFPVTVDPAGLALLAFHFLLYTLWLCATTLLVNLIAIFRGSSSAFVLAAGGQLVCVTMLLTLQKAESPLSVWQAATLRGDPISRLILGWQSVSWPSSFIPDTPYPPLSAEWSVLWLLVLCLAMAFAGRVIVRRHDLLTTDVESGGI